ncbi:hypothetical protein QNH10_12850 [Sporosarcina thermotolerans]|nr:hypothetical protein [Sporosarcina thermotolerans]WHT49926.1 hypothetical protein QNH10_12850 [Sporosarcina thermotolerans]
MLAGGFTASEVARAYKLSNREKEFLSAVHVAFDRRQLGRYTTDDYYRFPFDVICAAENIWQAFNPSEDGIPQHEIAMKQRELPIRSKDELQVNGKDLMAWTEQRGGPWLGEWMDRIEKAVLHRECPNDTEKIKEWFFNEYKRQE